MAPATEGALSDLTHQQENPGLPPDMEGRPSGEAGVSHRDKLCCEGFQAGKVRNRWGESVTLNETEPGISAARQNMPNQRWERDVGIMGSFLAESPKPIHTSMTPPPKLKSVC